MNDKTDNIEIRWENDMAVVPNAKNFKWHYSGYINDGMCAYEVYERSIGKYLYDVIYRKVYPVSSKENGFRLADALLNGKKDSNKQIKEVDDYDASWMSNLPSTDRKVETKPDPKEEKKLKDLEKIATSIKGLLNKI